MVKMPRGATGFPFHTQSAEKVFQTAKDLIKLYPKAGAGEIRKMAIDKAQVLEIELTPEDELTLDIAIHYAQTGRDEPSITPPIVRTGKGFYRRSGMLDPRGAKWPT
jgi:hypothetical protein